MDNLISDDSYHVKTAISGNNNRKKGEEYENQAAQYLQQKGFRILEHNLIISFPMIPTTSKRQGVVSPNP